MPTRSAKAVLRLERAGWTDVGKTNLHEFAYGVTSQNLHYGAVPNPAFPDRTPGGSSGGSAAALVLDLADGALGTDTGGSIRIPAACCGVTGLKPTYGLVPIDGVFPLAPSFDHAGPMARDVAGCVELMQALVPGFTVDEVSIDDLSHRRRVGRRPGSAGRLSSSRPPRPSHRHSCARSAMSIASCIRRTPSSTARTSAAKIERCIAVDDGEYSAAVRARAELAERALAAFEGHDLLVTPTLSIAPPAADVVEVEVRAALTLFTFPFNALGWPALALPARGRRRSR